MQASMATRPCLSSADLRYLKFSTLPSAVNPTGSQNPTGAWTPSSFSNAQAPPATEALPVHISGPVVPTVPFWTNMARMAVIARRELASSELSFLVLISGSLDVIAFQPRSPGVPVFQSLPRPLEYSTKAP